MNKAQAQYAVAKALYEEAVANVNCESEAIHAALDNNQITVDEWLDQTEAVSEKYQTEALYSKLWAAEDAMIKWSHNRIRKLKKYAAHREELEAVFNAAVVKPMPSIRNRVVELAFRLQ